MAAYMGVLDLISAPKKHPNYKSKWAVLEIKTTLDFCKGSVIYRAHFPVQIFWDGLTEVETPVLS